MFVFCILLWYTLAYAIYALFIFHKQIIYEEEKYTLQRNSMTGNVNIDTLMFNLVYRRLDWTPAFEFSLYTQTGDIAEGVY